MPTLTKDALMGMIGKELGVSPWIRVDQNRINVFADVTEDHQFIHIDPERAAETPFGGPIAHGFLTLSLLSKLGEAVTPAIEGVTIGINYGFDKVRFLTPVASGSNVRGRFVLKNAVEKRPGQFLLTYGVTVEIEDEDNPALVADWLGMQVVG